jgi:hypothetical protein
VTPFKGYEPHTIKGYSGELQGNMHIHGMFHLFDEY